MSDSDSNENNQLRELTPNSVARVISGTATPSERQAYLQALRDPHSPLHDWLEGIGEWTDKVLTRNTGVTQEGDRIGNLALMVSNRNDLVTFVRDRHESGQLSKENLSSILAVGVLDEEDVPHTPQTYGRSTQRMMELLQSISPQLLDELMNLLIYRSRNGPP